MEFEFYSSREVKAELLCEHVNFSHLEMTSREWADLPSCVAIYIQYGSTVP